MKFIAFTLVYLGFFSLIGFAIYFTESTAPLWALLLTPSIKTSSEKDSPNE